MIDFMFFVLDIAAIAGYTLTPIVWLLTKKGIDLLLLLIMYLFPAMLFLFRCKMGGNERENQTVYFLISGFIYAMFLNFTSEIENAPPVITCVICFAALMYHIEICRPKPEEKKEEEHAEKVPATYTFEDMVDAFKADNRYAAAGILKAVFLETGHISYPPESKYRNKSYLDARDMLKEGELTDEKWLSLTGIDERIAGRLKDIYYYLDSVRADEPDTVKIYDIASGKKEAKDEITIKAEEIIAAWEKFIESFYTGDIGAYGGRAVYGVAMAIASEEVCNELRKRFRSKYGRNALDIVELYKERFDGRGGVFHCREILYCIYDDLGRKYMTEQSLEISLTYFLDKVRDMFKPEHSYTHISSGYVSDISLDYIPDVSDDLDDYLKEDEEHLEFNQAMDFFDDPDGGIDGYIESGWDYLGFGSDD